MKTYISIILVGFIFIFLFIGFLIYWQTQRAVQSDVLSEQVEQKEESGEYWFLLQRKSKREYLYQGVVGDVSQSKLVKEFQVNVGVAEERPTPLPKLVGREYWQIIAEFDTSTDPETAPYFLTLDVPWSDVWPYGPEPYLECGGEQCDWVRPGAFGLHGVAGKPEKLSDGGSSGCIRHSDEEIRYLYDLLSPSEEKPIRYYVEDI